MPERARSGGDTIAGAVERRAEVAANVGKTRVYHAVGGPAPPGVDELGEEVWRGNKPPPERGFRALGVPIGHDEYVRTQARERLQAGVAAGRAASARLAVRVVAPAVLRVAAGAVPLAKRLARARRGLRALTR